jgi:hypothetical protein
MANLNTKTLATGVGDILCVDGGISGDKQIKDGDGTASNLYIDGTNLGIGHATPTHYLDVKGSSTQPVKIESTGAYCTLDIRDADTSDFTGLYVNNGRLSLYTGDNSRLSILSNGNVGIGTDSPGTKLDVYGSGLVSQAVRSTNDHCTFHIQAGTSGVTSDKLAYLYMGNIGGSNNGVIKYHNNATGADRTMEFQLNGTTPLTLVGEGRVGIGTSAPNSPLEIVSDTNTETNGALLLRDSGSGNHSNIRQEFTPFSSDSVPASGYMDVEVGNTGGWLFINTSAGGYGMFYLYMNSSGSASTPIVASASSNEITIAGNPTGGTDSKFRITNGDSGNAVQFRGLFISTLGKFKITTISS